MEDIQKKHDILLFYEETFARNLATGVIVRRPIILWHILIPFMFIFRILSMKRETETFAQNFLFIRKLALDAALNITKGEDRQARIARIEKETRDRLDSQKLYSTRLHRGQMTVVDLLIDFYSKLLNAEGSKYDALVKNAYHCRSNYEAFQKQLTLAEKEVDNAVLVVLGEAYGAWEEILTKQTVIDQLREKERDRIFSEE